MAERTYTDDEIEEIKNWASSATVRMMIDLLAHEAMLGLSLQQIFTSWAHSFNRTLEKHPIDGVSPIAIPSITHQQNRAPE